jgi:hypothetical protein
MWHDDRRLGIGMRVEVMNVQQFFWKTKVTADEMMAPTLVERTFARLIVLIGMRRSKVGVCSNYL